MKATTINSPDFQPITMQITFESEDDLRCLWHHLNVSGNDIRDVGNSAFVCFPENFGATQPIWEEINNICLKLGVNMSNFYSKKEEIK